MKWVSTDQSIERTEKRREMEAPIKAEFENQKNKFLRKVEESQLEFAAHLGDINSNQRDNIQCIIEGHGFPQIAEIIELCESYIFSFGRLTEVAGAFAVK